MEKAHCRTRVATHNVSTVKDRTYQERKLDKIAQSTRSTCQLNNQASLGNRNNTHHHISKLSALSIWIGLPDQPTVNENSSINQICPARIVYFAQQCWFFGESRRPISFQDERPGWQFLTFFFFFFLSLITFIQSTINNQKYLQKLRYLHYLQYNI